MEYTRFHLSDTWLCSMPVRHLCIWPFTKQGNMNIYENEMYYERILQVFCALGYMIAKDKYKMC